MGTEPLGRGAETPEGIRALPGGVKRKGGASLRELQTASEPRRPLGEPEVIPFFQPGFARSLPSRETVESSISLPKSQPRVETRISIPSRSMCFHEFVPGERIASYLRAMPTTLDLITATQQGYTEVDIGGYSYGPETQASFRFRHCDPLVVRSPDTPGYRGLTHIIPGDDPTTYIAKVASEFGDITRLEALLIKSEGTDRSVLLQVLQDLGIAAHAEEVPLDKTVYGNRAYRKDVIVIPEKNKVIVNVGDQIKEIDF